MIFGHAMSKSQTCKSLAAVAVFAVFNVLPWSVVAANEQNEKQSVHEYTLDNGMQLLVKPDHRAPIVVSQIWYKIGSSFEITGATGVSHVLEHMMFKGTDRFEAGEMSDLVARYGGSENAFTGRDYTGYYQVWEKSRLPASFAIEANRMQNLLLDPEQFAKEVKVVMEERRLRTDDSPVGTAYERFFAAAYVSSPYQGPVIGWMHDLSQLTLEFTQQWYEQWYAPNNSVLVVAGDVQPEEVFELAKKYFGDIPSKTLPKLPVYDEVPPKGVKRLVVEDKVEVPQLMMGFLVPSLATAENREEIFALSMLQQVLDGGLSARFETELVRGQQVAASVGAGYNPLARGDVLFSIMGAPTKNETLASLEAAIVAEIKKIQQEPPSKLEMDRALAQMKASDIFEQDSVYAQADILGRLAVIDLDWRLADQWFDFMSSVTPEQVQQVAQKYLIEKRLTVLNLVPQSEENTSDASEPQAQQEIESTGEQQ